MKLTNARMLATMSAKELQTIRQRALDSRQECEGWRRDEVGRVKDAVMRGLNFERMRKGERPIDVSGMVYAAALQEAMDVLLEEIKAEIQRRGE